MRHPLLPWTAAILLLLLASAVAASTGTVLLTVEGMTCGS